MCYSAMVWADYRKYIKQFRAKVSIEEFVQLFQLRANGGKVPIPRGMEASFADPQTDDERSIKTLIDAFTASESTRFEQELFTQRTRLVEAERKLQAKATKGAVDSKRIATNKIARAMDKLADLRRTDLKDSDSRIYPGTYAPVIVIEDGQRVIKPMRYQCRPAGKPAFYDTEYPGTYNARRDNLEGFWRKQFGYSHGLMVVNAFYEHVRREVGQATENVILEFRPRPTQNMLVACLWSRWSAPGEADLLSFAAITDEPPQEVAAAGHDRCIIPIKPENMDAWLNPDARNLKALYAVLDDRERPYYEHRLAA